MTVKIPSNENDNSRLQKIEFPVNRKHGDLKLTINFHNFI